MTATIDRTTAKTMVEIEITNSNKDTNKEIRTTPTGMTITKIETDLITEGDQTSINTTETNTRHKSSSNSQTKT